jgi:hypothetical protein
MDREGWIDPDLDRAFVHDFMSMAWDVPAHVTHPGIPALLATASAQIRSTCRVISE